jgi:hypothetical protein
MGVLNQYLKARYSPKMGGQEENKEETAQWEKDMVSKDLHYNHEYPIEERSEKVEWVGSIQEKSKPAPTRTKKMQKSLHADMVNHPPHYTEHPSGIECIEITRYMGFNIGNAVKYLWRCDLKHDDIEDLEKAIFYIYDEIKKRKQQIVQDHLEANQPSTVDPYTLSDT